MKVKHYYFKFLFHYEVYGINHLEGSIVINLGVLIASPLNFITSTVGAILGTLMGVAFLSSTNSGLQEVNLYT